MQHLVLSADLPARPVDFTVMNGGSVWLFSPLTDDARAWWVDHVNPDTMQMGGAFAVEARFANDIADGIILEGFETYPPTNPAYAEALRERAATQ